MSQAISVNSLRHTLFSWETWLLRLRQLGTFGSWQIGLQCLQLITGFLLIRWLSYEAYAQYGLALSFQNMLGALIDIGFSGSIVALVGERIHDRELLGRHLRSAESLRARLLFCVVPLSAVPFFWFASHHQWPAGVSMALFLSIAALLHFQGSTSIHSAPLLIHQRLSGLYRPQIAVSAIILLLCTVLEVFFKLSAVTICWMNVGAAAIIGYLYRQASRPFFSESAAPNPETVRALRKYLAPLLAGAIFYAFHGQLQILLISIFGGQRSIAEVVALGRIGQVLIFASAFVTTLLVPCIARVSLKTAGIRYFQAVALLTLGALTLSLAAFLAPEAFLLLLGDKYKTLHAELGLAVSASSASLLSGTLYAFNNARQWTNHRAVAFGIGGILAIDALLISLLDMSVTRNVLLLSLLTNLFPIIPFACAAFNGYRQNLTEASTVGETATAI